MPIIVIAFRYFLRWRFDHLRRMDRTDLIPSCKRRRKTSEFKKLLRGKQPTAHFGWVGYGKESAAYSWKYRTHQHNPRMVALRKRTLLVYAAPKSIKEFHRLPQMPWGKVGSKAAAAIMTSISSPPFMRTEQKHSGKGGNPLSLPHGGGNIPFAHMEGFDDLLLRGLRLFVPEGRKNFGVPPVWTKTYPASCAGRSGAIAITIESGLSRWETFIFQFPCQFSCWRKSTEISINWKNRLNERKS